MHRKPGTPFSVDWRRLAEAAPDTATLAALRRCGSSVHRILQRDDSLSEEDMAQDMVLAQLTATAADYNDALQKRTALRLADRVKGQAQGGRRAARATDDGADGAWLQRGVTPDAATLAALREEWSRLHAGLIATATDSEREALRQSTAALGRRILSAETGSRGLPVATATSAAKQRQRTTSIAPEALAERLQFERQGNRIAIDPRTDGPMVQGGFTAALERKMAAAMRLPPRKARSESSATMAARDGAAMSEALAALAASIRRRLAAFDTLLQGLPVAPLPVAQPTLFGNLTVHREPVEGLHPRQGKPSAPGLIAAPNGLTSASDVAPLQPYVVGAHGPVCQGFGPILAATTATFTLTPGALAAIRRVARVLV